MKCKNCGKIIKQTKSKTQHSKRVYCSKKCMWDYNRSHKKGWFVSFKYK